MGLLIEKKEAVLTVDFNAPPFNVLRSEAMKELIDVLDRETDVKVAVLKGEGKFFCAGLDVKEHLPGEVEALIPLFSELILKLFTFPGIVVSIVQGGALGGGCEIAFCSDLLIADKGAVFSQPEIKLGVLAPAACALYPLLFPSKVINYLITSGENLTAEELEKLGVVNRTFDKETLYEEADAFLRPMTKLSAATLHLVKKASRLHLPQLQKNLEAVNGIYLDELMKTEDALEGLKSFVEKRKPVWKNK